MTRTWLAPRAECIMEPESPAQKVRSPGGGVHPPYRAAGGDTGYSLQGSGGLCHETSKRGTQALIFVEWEVGGQRDLPTPQHRTLLMTGSRKAGRRRWGGLGTSCSNLRPPGDCLRDLGQVMGLRTPCSDQVTRKRTPSSRVFLRLVKQEAPAGEPRVPTRWLPSFAWLLMSFPVSHPGGHLASPGLPGS